MAGHNGNNSKGKAAAALRSYELTRTGKIPVIAVVGPTASGKTGLAVKIARWYGGEVVSADSMQIYRGLDIATAKPDPAETKGVLHHLIGFQDPARPFSVADYTVLAHAALADILKRGRLPILAGGTGLYVDSTLEDICFGDFSGDPERRKQLADYADQNGADALWKRLAELDPEGAAELHPNNRGRIIRAIELAEATGLSMAEQRRRSRGETRYLPLRIGLDYKERQALYNRIDDRVDDMVRRGLLEEAERFLADSGGATAAQAIGCKELAPYFAGEIPLGQALESLKRETRRYAKRQLTWFRRSPEVHWFFPDIENDEKMEKYIRNDIDNFLTMCYDEV